ncbi:unnamed protein product [Ilex paraguariensis]|uniref:Uncharacterized protein n=1 Tax=Ilex paraguariensis TaxID=185542 RepID=A0ABC8QZV0_9AQUA
MNVHHFERRYETLYARTNCRIRWPYIWGDSGCSSVNSDENSLRDKDGQPTNSRVAPCKLCGVLDLCLRPQGRQKSEIVDL